MKPKTDMSNITETVRRAKELSSDGTSLSVALSDAAAEQHVAAKNLRLSAEKFAAGVGGAASLIDNVRLLTDALGPDGSVARAPGILAGIRNLGGDVEMCAAEIATHVLRGESPESATDLMLSELRKQSAASKAPPVPSIAPVQSVPLHAFPAEPRVRIKETRCGGITLLTRTREP
jgi:hypothetical protein